LRRLLRTLNTENDNSHKQRVNKPDGGSGLLHSKPPEDWVQAHRTPYANCVGI
jgi:hypothetical protein